MIILGGKTLCRYLLAHGETRKKSGKTVNTDQVQDHESMVAQRFTTLFEVFQVKELLQNHGFSDNVLKYFTLIIS